MPKGKQFSDIEKRNLQELVLKYSKFVENKDTDAISLQRKKNAWEKILIEYNDNSDNSQKDVRQLKKLWENIKFKRKTELATKKRTIIKTGSPVQAAGNNPELLDSCCNADIRIKDTIDNDTLLMEENQSGPYVIIDDVLIPDCVIEGSSQAVDLQHKGNESETSDNEETSTSQASCREQSRTSSRPITKGTKRNLLQEEAELKIAELRIQKASYLVKLEKEIGNMRKQEQSLKCKLAKQQLETAKDEAQFLRQKHEIELEILKNKFSK